MGIVKSNLRFVTAAEEFPIARAIWPAANSLQSFFFGNAFALR
jgi:hypothetical protein